MTVKAILPFGDPVLRKKAKPVTEFNARLARVLDDLRETLYAEEGRAGLAAPQIGILRRVAVLDCGSGLIELINPEIVERRGEQTGPEACLSFPGYYGLVKRAAYVKVRTMDRSGAERLIEAEDYVARCMQHEIDHLDGVLFIDHVKEPVLRHEHTGQTVRLLDVIALSNRNL